VSARSAAAGGTGASPGTERGAQTAAEAIRHLGPLRADLHDTPTAFEFFQAVRLLERLHPDRPRVGEIADPTREVVRFSVNPSIAFPAAEINTLELGNGEPARMNVNFFGLVGPVGVLPYPYSMWLLERARARDGAPAAFLDLFHHRLIALFYRAWLKNNVTASYESNPEGQLSLHLLDLIGEGVQAEHRGITPLQKKLLFYGGLLGPQPRGAVGLEQFLEDIFDVHIEVEQFVGGWYRLPLSDQCAMGEDDGPSTQLGIGAVAGDEVWDQQTRVRIRMGPLAAEQYADFLPSGAAHALLRWLVRFFSRDAFDFELQLVLAKEEVPACVLGSATAQPLGWSTWIRTRPFTHDPDQTIVQLQSLPTDQGAPPAGVARAG
jgi:type VI secretion system protein ImpH